MSHYMYMQYDKYCEGATTSGQTKGLPMENNEGLPTDSPSDDQGADGTPDAGTPTDRRPLGYWLRLVDGLIAREFASTLENEGVGRRDWMLLNVVSGAVDAPGLAERLARRGGKHLRRLEDRDWIAQAGDGTWTLTDEGRAAQERLSGLVDGIREKVAGAVSPEDFATMTASLEAIARELGWDETTPWPGRGFGPGGRGFRGRGFGPGGREFGGREFGGRGSAPAPGSAASAPAASPGSARSSTASVPASVASAPGAVRGRATDRTPRAMARPADRSRWTARTSTAASARAATRATRIRGGMATGTATATCARLSPRAAAITATAASNTTSTRTTTGVTARHGVRPSTATSAASPPGSRRGDGRNSTTRPSDPEWPSRGGVRSARIAPLLHASPAPGMPVVRCQLSDESRSHVTPCRTKAG